MLQKDAAPVNYSKSVSAITRERGSKKKCNGTRCVKYRVCGNEMLGLENSTEKLSRSWKTVRQIRGQ